MKFVPSFQVNQTVTNKEITTEFSCANMGGMRRSRATNTLVLISDNTKGIYEDKWYGDVLHYTGMGMSGDQDLNFMQNPTLAKSRNNGVVLHLFEVLIPRNYIYRGEVELYQEPYQTTQRGEDESLRRVWIFPVRLISDDQPVDEILIKEYEERKSRQARKLTLSELRQRADDVKDNKASVRSVKSDAYIRDPYVSEYAKRMANGVCQLCRMKAPFIDKNGFPYLETHHIEWLAKGGTDTIDNTVALCPNCHRRLHMLDLDEDRKKLLKL